VLHRLFHLGFARSHQREPIMSADFPRAQGLPKTNHQFADRRNLTYVN
jgi:hypothetical protein